MFNSNTNKDVNSIHSNLFSDQRSETIKPCIQFSKPEASLSIRQRSTQPLHKIHKHYKEFQYALNALKVSVEELWLLELDQLRDHGSISVHSSNLQFDFQVPSTYACRSILPVTSGALCLENRIASNVNAPTICQSRSKSSIHETVSNKMRIIDNVLRPKIQYDSYKQKPTRTPLAVNKKRRRSRSNSIFTKYWINKALLHLKFRCSRHHALTSNAIS